MYTPHPSLVPIEMASAGMLTVTNTFENKTAEALAAISPNLIAAEPSVEGVADGARARRRRAPTTSSARVARQRTSRWSRDWDESFGDALLDAACSACWSADRRAPAPARTAGSTTSSGRRARSGR